MFEHIINFSKAIFNKIDSYSDIVRSNRKLYAILWIGVILVSFAVVLFLNISTPLISDDITYLYIYGETGEITSVSDIIQSQKNHYYLWGGRSVVHFIAQLLLMLPSFLADILNATIYILFISLIYWHCKGRGKASLSLFVLIGLAVWFLQPVFGDTVLWITGSANYLWGTTFVLLFLLPYRMYNGDSKSQLITLFYSITILLWGIIAGWTNENTAGAMVLIALLFLYYYRRQGWNIPLWTISGIVGGLIGFLVMILAPGNFERAGEASSLSLYVFGYRLFNYTLTFFYYGGVAVLLAAVMLVLYNQFYREKHERASVLSLSLIYYIAAIAAVYAMLLSPTFPRRALFGVVTFLIIGAGILYYNLNFKETLVRQLRALVLLIGLISFVFTFYLASKEIMTYQHIVVERESRIEQAKQDGISSCEFDRFDGGIYIHGEDPYSAKAMSLFYGIEIELK